MGTTVYSSFDNAAISCKLYISIRGLINNTISDQFIAKGKCGADECLSNPVTACVKWKLYFNSYIDLN